jgi:hypothetical protein
MADAKESLDAHKAQMHLMSLTDAFAINPQPATVSAAP